MIPQNSFAIARMWPPVGVLGDFVATRANFWCAFVATDPLAMGTATIASEMQPVRVQNLHRTHVRDKRGELSEAVLEIRDFPADLSPASSVGQSSA
jgi:hypothetical protein